jgi:hypothetical protein
MVWVSVNVGVIARTLACLKLGFELGLVLALCFGLE